MREYGQHPTIEEALDTLAAACAVQGVSAPETIVVSQDTYDLIERTVDARYHLYGGRRDPADLPYPRVIKMWTAFGPIKIVSSES